MIVRVRLPEEENFAVRRWRRLCLRERVHLRVTAIPHCATEAEVQLRFGGEKRGTDMDSLGGPWLQSARGTSALRLLGAFSVPASPFAVVVIKSKPTSRRGTRRSEGCPASLPTLTLCRYGGCRVWIQMLRRVCPCSLTSHRVSSCDESSHRSPPSDSSIISARAAMNCLRLAAAYH